jgi:hypothetical protein
MKRMTMLASIANAGAGELQANLDKYKEESEKEEINEVRCVCFSSVNLSLSDFDRVIPLYTITTKGMRQRQAARMELLIWSLQ